MQPFYDASTDTAFVLLSVTPTFGYAGTLITVAIDTSRDPHTFGSSYQLNGDWLPVEYWSPETVQLRLPRLLTFTGMYIDAGNLRTYDRRLIKIDFRPVPEACGDSVCVAWFDTDTVTEALADRYSRGIEWTMEASGDTINLRYSYELPNEVYHTVTTFVDRGPGVLPRFVRHTIQAYPPFQDTLRLGLIKIDQWDPRGIVSGGIFRSEGPSPYYRYFQTYFFARSP